MSKTLFKGAASPLHPMTWQIFIESSLNAVILSAGEGGTGAIPPRLFTRVHTLPAGLPLPL